MHFYFATFNISIERVCALSVVLAFAVVTMYHQTRNIHSDWFCIECVYRLSVEYDYTTKMEQDEQGL
jgi:hypothetical protein